MSRLYDLRKRTPFIEDPLPVVTEVVFAEQDGTKVGVLVPGEPDMVTVQRMRPKAVMHRKVRVWDRQLLLYIDQHGLDALTWSHNGWSQVR